MKPQAALIEAVLAVALLFVVAHSVAQQSLQVRVDRWLEVRQVTNDVTFAHDSTRRAAKVGDWLQAVGDSIITGKKSSALSYAYLLRKSMKMPYRDRRQACYKA